MNSKEAKKLFAETHFYMPLFGMFYHFTDSKEDFDKMMEWIGCQQDLNGIGGKCVQAQNGDETRIWIGLFNEDLGSLAHEASHAALYTLKCIGQELSYSDELLPYLTGWIFNECQNKISTKQHLKDK